jgi:hypothetical protein
MIARRSCAWLGTLIISATAGWAADPISGPEPGKKIAPLKVFAATGPKEGKELDYAAERGERPTVYVLIRDWDRPVARFIKTLDGAVKEESDQALAVAAWLTDDKDATKKYLPLAQQSLKLEVTPLVVALADKPGPDDWDINPDARVTVVVAKKGKVAARFGYLSINDTDVRRVRASLREALKG